VHPAKVVVLQVPRSFVCFARAPENVDFSLFVGDGLAIAALCPRAFAMQG
jgi:hypothetical protein